MGNRGTGGSYDFDKLNIAQLIDDSREARALDALIVFRNTEARQEKEIELAKKQRVRKEKRGER